MPHYKVIDSMFGKTVSFVEDPLANDVIIKCGCGKEFLFTHDDVAEKNHMGEVAIHVAQCGQEIKPEVIPKP